MPSVAARRVQLRPPAPGDAAAFIQLAQRSKAFHAPWTQAPSTPVAFAQYLEQLDRPDHQGFLVCVADECSPSGRIAGAIHLSQIAMGNFRSAYLGYHAFAGFERQGIMRAGLRQVVRHAFGTLKLHRLEANIQPDNQASIHLVKACGFVQEGFSPRYLKIGGRWRDHERWALVAD